MVRPVLLRWPDAALYLWIETRTMAVLCPRVGEFPGGVESVNRRTPPGIPRSSCKYLRYHQHRGLPPISSCVIINIVGSQGSDIFSTCVFINIVG